MLSMADELGGGWFVVDVVDERQQRRAATRTGKGRQRHEEVTKFWVCWSRGGEADGGAAAGE